MELLAHRIQSLLILLASLMALGVNLDTATAQSFWEHKYVFNGGLAIAASDTDDYVFTSSGFDPAITHDYGTSWKSIFVDSPRITHGILGLVHPSKSLIILGCDDQLETKRVDQNGNIYLQAIAVGVIVRSTDGGATWSDSAIGSPDTLKPHNPIGAIAALDSNHIFIPVGGDHYLLSSDGGASWNSISCPVGRHYVIANLALSLVNPVAAYPGPNILVVAEIDSSYAWANYPSKIYRSTDLGVTWSQGFQTSDNIQKFAFTSPSVGYAAGFIMDATSYDETAMIDKTTDGGLTWFNIYSQRLPELVGLRSIAFADSLDGIAVGPDGLILRTTDAGTNWVRETSDITDGEFPNLVDVAFPSKTKAMIATAGGEVFIYRPNGLLDLPNITYPQPIGVGNLSIDSNFTVTWDPVPGATRYALWVEDQNNRILFKDTNIQTTSYHLSGFDTVPNLIYSLSQYWLYVQAFSADNKSNVASRTFRVPALQSSVSELPGGPISQYRWLQPYPNPARDMLNVEGFSGKVSILDALGRAHACPLQNGKLDISMLPAGIYYVSDGHSRAKFVKE
ncbi:MAG TPA: T9SS type A sorting domain-containing protein [Candidatus Kapabacteria bacterium]|nr:T9SS type A sorting domain-containing protein [Candidatus Kapabacteria bacterium]